MKYFCFLFSFLLLTVFACTDKSANPATSSAAAEAQTETSAPATTETPFQDSIPPPVGYVFLASAKGDLDKDGQDEKAVVYDTGRQTDYGSEREIQIFKKKDTGWELWHKSVGPVMGSEQGGVMGDPFEGLSIENGSLVLSHFGGSREKWHYTHRFRFQNNDWQLIGATVNNGAPCDYFEDFDYNLSTGKIDYKKTTEDCEKSEEHPVTKTTQKDFVVKPKALPSMDGFHPGENQIKLPKTDIEFYY